MENMTRKSKLKISLILSIFVFCPYSAFSDYSFSYQPIPIASGRNIDVLHFSEDKGKTWKKVPVTAAAVPRNNSGLALENRVHSSGAFVTDLKKFLGVDDLSSLINMNRDPSSGRTFDYLSQGTVNQYKQHSVQSKTPSTVDKPYFFQFFQSPKARGRNLLHFYDDREKTWKEVPVTAAAAPKSTHLALENRLTDSGPFITGLKSFLGVDDLKSLIEFNQNPSGVKFDFLSEGTLDAYRTARLANLVRTSSSSLRTGLSAPVAACSSTQWPPSASPGFSPLNFRPSFRGWVEFYHHDQDKCDPPADPINHWLGNFYPVQITVPWGTYQTAEAAFQAKKCLLLYPNPSDPRQAPCLSRFAGAQDGEAAFVVSKSLPPIPPTWLAERDQAMLEVLTSKFRNPQLCSALIKTHPYPLHETIPQSRSHDPGAMHWGAPPHDPHHSGENMLGTLLTIIRGQSLITGCPR
jgi:predicted NAD-dependent protein-ADP-ribosyltransferase YbiA (DUF1768 family)